MGSFWSTSDGETIQGESSFETPSGNTDPIPDNSSVLARITSAQWKSPRDEPLIKYVELEWTIQEPADYVNRKVWHKLWVDDLDPSVLSKQDGQKKAERKRDNARRMLAAIDANAGGKLAKKNSKPTDEELALALTNRPMIIKLRTWDDQQTGKPAGNWVVAVSSAKTGRVEITAAPVKSNAVDEDPDFVPF